MPSASEPLNYQTTFVLKCSDFSVHTAMVDAIITDPPYGNFYGSQRKKITKAVVDGDDMTWIEKFVPLAKHVCQTGPIVLFCDRHRRSLIEQKMMEAGFNFINDAIWFKRPWGIGYNFRPAHDHILLFSRAKTIKASHHSLSSVLQHNKINKKRHPTEKPVSLMEELILGLTKEGDTILDPFMGVGSTGVACVRNNRNFYGYDIIKDYVAIAKIRIKEVLP